MRVRIERARQLLSETDLPLDRVAAAVGYEHAEYFSVAFRRQTSETPAAYRKRVRAGKTPSGE